MGIVFEHVKTRTRWREQHQVACFRELLRRTHRLRQALHTDHGFTQRFEHVLDLGCIFAHQNHRLHVLLNGAEQWREILSLAHSTQNHHQGPLLSQRIQGRTGGTNIGAFAVVHVLNTVQDPDGLDAMRLATIVLQGMEHGCHVRARCACQRQSRHGIQGIVGPTDFQGIQGHQALNGYRLQIQSTGFDPHLGIFGAHQPDHACAVLQTKISGSLGCLSTILHPLGQGFTGGATQRAFGLVHHGFGGQGGTQGGHLGIVSMDHSTGVCRE